MSIEALIFSGHCVQYFFPNEVDDVSRERYYIQITASVLRWYVELESGCIRTTSNEGDGQTISEQVFVPGLVEYRADVDNVLRAVSSADRAALLLVHRDGLTHADAVKSAGIVTARPDSYVRQLESKLGRLLERRKLDDLHTYILG